MTALAQGLMQFQQEVWSYLAVFFRIGAMVALLPAFGEATIPMRVKLGAAIAFTAIVGPAVGMQKIGDDLLAVLNVLGAEVFIGLLLGLGFRLFVMALQIAGTIAAQSTSLAQLLGGASVEPIPAMGYVLVLAGTALAVTMDLHVQIAEMMILSYQLFPVGAWPAPSMTAEWAIMQVGRAFGLAFSLAAPFVIASLLYNLALGAINRAMPQLMVAFVGAPAITLGGLGILMLASPLLLQVWAEALFSFARNPMAPVP